jgi:hypothetical protein
MIENRTPRRPIQIDMNPDGSFNVPPETFRQSPFGQPRFAPPGPISSAVLRWALVIAGVATLGAVAFFVLWLAMILVPVAVGAGLLAYGALRYRVWKSGGSFRGFSRRR